MKNLFIVLFLLISTSALAVPSGKGPAGTSGGGGGGTLQFQEEGGNIAQRATINCTGTGITCADVGGKTEIQVNAGGGATITLQEDDVTVDASTTTVDLLGTDFDLTSSPAGEVNIVINSSLARDAEVAASYQPLDSDLTNIAAVATTAFGRGLLDDADATAGRSSLGVVIGTNVQAWDTDLDDLADGSLTGTKVGFADTDNLFTATNVQAAIEEFNDSINAGVPNGVGAKTHWSQLTGMPAGFADGTDDGGGISVVTTLPGSPVTGDLVIVTDDSSIDACDSGGGTSVSACVWNGSAWEPLIQDGGVHTFAANQVFPAPFFTGIIDYDNGSTDDDTCNAGQAGTGWWDNTDNRFEWCQVTDGSAPLTLAAAAGDVGGIGDCTSGDCFEGVGSESTLKVIDSFNLELDDDNNSTSFFNVKNGAGTTIMELDEDGNVVFAGTVTPAATATPSVVFDDIDSGSETQDVTIETNCTDAGAGTEDCDATIYVQTNSVKTARVSIDADGATSIPSLLTTRTQSAAVKSPTNSDDFMLFKAPAAITVTAINCLVDPADSAESVVLTVNEYDGNGDNASGIDGATTITCGNTNTADDGSLSNAAVDSGDWVGVDLGTVTGTVSFLSITVTYTIVN